MIATDTLHKIEIAGIEADIWKDSEGWIAHYSDGQSLPYTTAYHESKASATKELQEMMTQHILLFSNELNLNIQIRRKPTKLDEFVYSFYGARTSQGYQTPQEAFLAVQAEIKRRSEARYA